MASNRVDDVIASLDRAGNRIRCSELQELLESLGFYFKHKKTPGHKVYFHDGLPSFTNASFNCDHKKDPPVKAPYIQRARRELKIHKEDLIKYLEAQR